MADAQGCTEQITVRLEEAGVIDAIEILQEHENNDVYNAAFTIIDTLNLINSDASTNSDRGEDIYMPEV